MNDMRPSLDIIIVNWNAGAQLRECIASIPIALDDTFTLANVVVVDNSSADDSLDGLCNNGLPIRVIKNAKNLGFAKACNIGAKGSLADFLLFLNPDTKLFEASLAVPIQYMADRRHDDVGVVGIQLLNERGLVARSCARFPALGAFVAHTMGVDKMSLFKAFGYRMADWPHDATRVVDHVIGAFFFVRRCAFASLSGFDEDYFVYLEDLDFSSRLQAKGYCSVYLAGAQAFHAGGGTSQAVMAKRLFYSLRSRLLYGFKHFGVVSALCIAFLTLAVEPTTRTAEAALRMDFKRIRDTWRAYGMLYRSIPQLAMTLRRKHTSVG